MHEQEDLMDNAGHSGQESVPALTVSADQDARMAWWREAKVGLFIHWGLYSLQGGFWKGQEVQASYAEHLMLRAQIPVREYEEIAAEFRAERFEARQWARMAKQAGLQYLIYTAKHHDGFAMYDSDVSDYNMVQRTPFGRDPLRELADACREEGVKLCIYYSHSMDWHHPDSQGNIWDYPANIGAYDDVASWIDDEDKRSRYENYLSSFALPQVKELLEKYGPIGLMWFDCGHKLTAEQGTAFVEQVRGVQPDCLVNRRVWMEPYGDYGNSSDNQPHVRVPREDWESIATFNDSWGYKATDHNWKTSVEVLQQMIDVLSQNGNFVINVGPTGDGAFDPKSVELLEQIGAWMQINSDAVYGTRKSPIGKPPWGRSTIKDNTLYLHIFEWPQSGKLVVPGLRNAVLKAYALADTERRALPVHRQNEEDIVIDVPQELMASTIPVFAVDFAGACDASSVSLLYTQDYPNRFDAFDAHIAGSTLRYDTGKKDHDNLVNWKILDDEASWKFRSSGIGHWKVALEYGADEQAAGGSYELSVYSSSTGERVAHILGQIRSTGGWYDFDVVDIGSLSIPHAGEYVLKLGAASLEGDMLMCLKRIVLEPS
ncbi:alpha-L-fucosidase [Paenibacillus radicis (ex Xue et al. 2023)]|uniref:alpha-L-fucosidase n=1 Tax=Paenibacillus radicis (ex Xue et al. 2023) TaxID=2972489 RepID=A0ABT1YPI3_9BACL|nr:alpha-L-fucosidase [Paenibacillus radicis (ex Xue et al. 2023)]MCR8635091.1 alpha-L-fucosidase [Paenibacillus radicis (ex Xue et al. 2023)]